MQGTWTIQPWDPNTCSAETWQRFHRYRRIRREEHDPSHPLMADDIVEANLRRPSEWSIDHRFVAKSGDAIVGMLSISEPKPGASGYESGKHILGASAGVIAPARRQGIGSAFLRQVAEFMRAGETTVLTVHSSEPDGQAFADWFGAELKQMERISRLSMDRVDWEQQARWVADLETRAPGTKLELYPDRLPEDFLEEYCPARQEMMNLMPWDDLEHGEIEQRPEDFKELYERLDLNEEDHHTYISREPDGRISGITDVSWGPHQPGIVYQWFTGVHPDFRGRGLGKALKGAMALYVNERYDGLEWISTGNAASNASMLAINEKMGFREHKRYHSYQIGRDTLLAFAEGLSERAPVRLT